MLLIGLSWILFASFFYVESMRNGLNEKRWGLAAVLMGPLLWPLFSIEIRMKRIRDRGYDYCVIKA